MTRDAFVTIQVNEHEEVKKILLPIIEQAPANSIVNDEQRIIKTDWNIPRDVPREYEPPLEILTAAHCYSVQDILKFRHHLKVVNFWFQQYEKGDFHKWHVHGDSVFSNVYYLELPEGAAQTTFRFMGEEFTVSVKEGQILTFPSFYEHCSKPNEGGRKTVIAFNTNFKESHDDR
jgi:hypothetical protein